jgi:hypothetical protein
MLSQYKLGLSRQVRRIFNPDIWGFSFRILTWTVKDLEAEQKVVLGIRYMLAYQQGRNNVLQGLLAGRTARPG